jgi:hypothetical protein
MSSSLGVVISEEQCGFFRGFMQNSKFNRGNRIFDKYYLSGRHGDKYYLLRSPISAHPAQGPGKHSSICSTALPGLKQ